MFTGLVEEVGKTISLVRRGTGAKLEVSASFTQEVRSGDSVSVNGICLTVTEIKVGVLSFDVSGETLSRSTLGKAAAGTPLNLERALRLSDRLGGHIVTGHIDGVARIVEKTGNSEHIYIRFKSPEKIGRYIVEKGSVAVDGISLTVNSCDTDGFSINVIPHTADMTSIGMKRVGDFVNIECDIIGKYVEKLLGNAPEPGRGSSLAHLLASSGFM